MLPILIAAATAENDGEHDETTDSRPEANDKVLVVVNPALDFVAYR